MGYNVYCNPGAPGTTVSVYAGSGVAGTITGTNSGILGGPLSTTGTHTINANCSMIVGGYNHTIDQGATNSFIGNGDGNFITCGSCFGIITGGQGNSIGNTSSALYSSVFGFIGGGSGNCIDTPIVAGPPYSTCFNAIVSGQNNVIYNTSCFSSIAGGKSNTNSGSYSAILGGSGNVIPSGCSYVGIFGKNIGTTSACIRSNTFHTECLQACSTPVYAATYPKDTFSYYYVPLGSPILADLCVAIVS